jgi:hypothetical protein
MLLIIVAASGVGLAKVDLVTLPSRDTVQLTIYNSAYNSTNVTLVRESRALTLKNGANALQFSWENTFIDPTSLEMLPKANADKIDIAELVYPPRVKNLGLWNIESNVSGKVPVEITYLTSRLYWRAFYMGTLTQDEKTMRLQGYVRVGNNSGEEYENAQIRLIVGKVHILDEIEKLAKRGYPYGRPEVIPPPTTPPAPTLEAGARARGAIEELALAMPSKPKEIQKEGLSEYFLYTIEGIETIPNRWSKRLQSFDVEAVPVVNLYKYEQERYGRGVVRFLSFKNDEDHRLGQTPIPGGMLKVYRDVGDQGHLSYTGQSSFKYIPVDEDVELNLGTVADIVVEPKLMDFKTENYRFDSRPAQHLRLGRDSHVQGRSEKHARHRRQGRDSAQLPDAILGYPKQRRLRTIREGGPGHGQVYSGLAAAVLADVRICRQNLSRRPRGELATVMNRSRKTELKEQHNETHSNSVLDNLYGGGHRLCQGRSGDAALAGYGAAYDLQLGGYDVSAREPGSDVEEWQEFAAILLGKHAHRPDQPGDAAESQCGQD